jgi:hypothetical protein
MGADPVKIEGGCLCGAVRYEADAFLDSAYYCHCKTCQRVSGTPAEVSVPVTPDSVKFSKGAPHYFRSSPFAERGFCPECGSRLLYRMLSGEWTTVTAGSLDHPEAIHLEKHYCVDSQLPWYKTHDELPRLRSEEIPELVASWAAVEQR